MRYYNSYVDSDNYTHSIDNVVVVYHFKYSIKDVIKKIRDIKERYKCIDYWERLDNKPCSKFSWYSADIHLDTGFYLQIGHYQLRYEGTKKNYITVPVVKLEVNPNKYRDNDMFDEVVRLFKGISWYAEIKKVDYAIDIPHAPDKVKLYAGRKQAGLYKGTRYYGQRHKHGYVKIYDKQKESKLDYECTRVEYTLFPEEMKKGFEFDQIFIHVKDVRDSNNDDVKLSSSLKVIADLCKVLECNDLSYDVYIEQLNYRTKKQVVEYLQGYGRQLKFNAALFEDLLNEMKRIYAVDEINSGNAPVELPLDEYTPESNYDEFVDVSDEEVEALGFD